MDSLTQNERSHVSKSCQLVLVAFWFIPVYVTKSFKFNFGWNSPFSIQSYALKNIPLQKCQSSSHMMRSQERGMMSKSVKNDFMNQIQYMCIKMWYTHLSLATQLITFMVVDHFLLTLGTLFTLWIPWISVPLKPMCTKKNGGNQHITHASVGAFGGRQSTCNSREQRGPPICKPCIILMLQILSQNYLPTKNSSNSMEPSPLIINEAVTPSISKPPSVASSPIPLTLLTHIWAWPNIILVWMSWYFIPNEVYSLWHCFPHAYATQLVHHI